MGRLPKTSTGRVALSLLVVIAFVGAVGFGITAAFAQESGTLTVRPCEGPECDGLNWCPITIGSTQGSCPVGLEVGQECCVGPCGAGAAACIDATSFTIMGTNCSFTGTPAIGCESECLPGLKNPCRFMVVNPVGVPTVSEWGLIVMGLLIVAAAVILIHRVQVAPRPA